MNVETLKTNFENEIKQRLFQKNSSKQNDEAFLLKQFKFFDLDNSGYLTKNEFKKALTRIGIIQEDDQFQTIFSIYDVDKDGYLDYKEFTGMMFGGKSESILPPVISQKTQERFNENSLERVKENLEKLKAKIQQRGSTGIIMLGHIFKIIDDNNSKSLDFNEFMKALKEYNLDFHQQDAKSLFDYFDRDHDGIINYEEFLYSLRGGLNAFRKQMVQKAFQKLDKDKSGFITFADLEGVYDPSRHPEVLKGKKSKEDVYLDFLQTFESYSDLKNIRDGKVTYEEFCDYYSYISCSIDSDKYFEAMINSAWKLEPAPSYQGQKAWAAEIDTTPYKKANVRSSEIEGFSKQNYYGNAPPLNQASLKKMEDNAPYKLNTQMNQKQIDLIIQRIRNRLGSRGPKGFLGLARHFKMIDLDNDQKLSLSEFHKAIRDYRIEVTDFEIESIFIYFDQDKNGSLDFEEFIRFIQGDITIERLKLINQVFDKIDQDQDGVITISEAKARYQTRNHPDVKSGRRTEEELLNEFVETLEAFKIFKGEFSDPKLSRQDFLGYFRNYSAAIPDDNFFTNILTACFKLVGETTMPQNTYAGMGSAKKTFDPTKKDKYAYGPASLNAPFGTFHNEPADNLKKNVNNTYNNNYNNNVFNNNTNTAANNNGQELLNQFRMRIKGRGANGIISLGRMFRIADDDSSKKIEFNEFFKVLNENRFDINTNDAKKLFSLFDHNRDGNINYDEFIRTVIGEMNERRKNIVHKAFQKLDKNSNGVIELDDVKTVYNAGKHPDVRAGKKSEDQILGEFIDTFEIKLATLKNDENLRDKRVTLEEFEEYYNNISCSIDNDEYFELMIKNCWNLDNVSYKKGWKNEFIDQPTKTRTFNKH